LDVPENPNHLKMGGDINSIWEVTWEKESS